MLLMEIGFFATGWKATLLTLPIRDGIIPKLNIQTWDNEKYLNKTKALGKKLLEARNNPSIKYDFAQHHKKMKKYLEKRNRSLEEKVASLLKSFPDKKIFVIAGENHVNPNALGYDLRDKLCIQNPSIKSTIIAFNKNFHSTTDDYLSDFVNNW